MVNLVIPILSSTWLASCLLHPGWAKQQGKYCMEKEEKENVVVFIASPVGMNGHVQKFLNMRIKNLDGLVSQRTKLGLNIVIS